MSVDIDANCRKRLIEVTTEALARTTVINGKFLYTPSTIGFFKADWTLPKQGKLRRQLESYVSETPYYDFASETLSRELNETQEYQLDDTQVPLSSLVGFENCAAYAEELVSRFQMVPWTYDFTVALPEKIGRHLIESLGPTEFSDKVALVALDDNYKTTHPLASGIKARDEGMFGSLLGSLSLGQDPKWPTQSAGLRIRFDGFVGHYGTTEPMREALSTLDSILGLCVALNILYLSPQYQPTVPRVTGYFHQQTSDEWVSLKRYELDAAQSRTITELTLNPKVESATKMQREGNFSYLAQRIRAIFLDISASQRIISAAKWLLNSYGTNDALLSFVQATVVLEILLGEEVPNEKLGLSELLKNRCAYLVAHTHKEREEVKTKFTEIYAVRSKIVHAGKSRLTNHESALLSELRSLGHRVLSKEIDLLLAS